MSVSLGGSITGLSGTSFFLVKPVVRCVRVVTIIVEIVIERRADQQCVLSIATTQSLLRQHFRPEGQWPLSVKAGLVIEKDVLVNALKVNHVR